MSLRSRRTFLWILGAVTLAVFAAAPGAWPDLVAGRLDHCPEFGCDFVHHYMPQARALRGDLVFGWVYPPLLALGLQPLVVLDDANALRVWMLLQALAIGSLGWACRQLLLPCGRVTSWIAAGALVVPSLPVLHSFKWGQVSTFIAVGAVWALARGRGRMAGVVLGLLAAIKIYPILYALPAVLRRDRAQLVTGFATALVAGLVLPLAVLGPQATLHYFESAWSVKWNHVGYLGGQALWPAFVRLFVTGRHAGVEPESQAPLLFSIGEIGPGSPPALLRTLALALPAIVVAGWTARVLWRRARTGRTGESSMLLLVAVGLCLAPGWHHYFAFLPVAMAAVLGRHDCRRRDVACVAAAWLATAAPVFALPFAERAYFHTSQWGCTTWAAVCVWWALVRWDGGEGNVTSTISGRRG